MLQSIPYLHLAWPGLRQNYPRQFGHGRASLPIYTGSANRALLANNPIYIQPDQAFAKFYLKLHIEHMNEKARSARVYVYTWPSTRSSPRQSSRGWPVWQG